MKIVVTSKTYWQFIQKLKEFSLPPSEDDPYNDIHGYLSIDGVSVPIYINNNI